MASNTIKGLTVEIGGDTTKLGKALADVDKKTRELSSELGQINKLLKLDPGNTDLLAQKQKVLAEAVKNTSEKLKTLQDAEKQVQEQFKRGEVSEEQVRALQREIIATSSKLETYENAAKETAESVEKLGKKSDETGDDMKDTAKDADKAEKSLDEFEDMAKDAEKTSSKLGDTLKGGLKAGFAAVAAGAVAAGAAAVALGKEVVEGYAEYEQLVGGVDTLFKDSSKKLQEYAANAYKTAGISGNQYMTTVTSFSASLISSLGGDTDKAVEYANMAITDMSDNANKFGSNVADIEHALTYRAA